MLKGLDREEKIVTGLIGLGLVVIAFLAFQVMTQRTASPPPPLATGLIANPPLNDPVVEAPPAAETPAEAPAATTPPGKTGEAPPATVADDGVSMSGDVSTQTSLRSVMLVAQAHYLDAGTFALDLGDAQRGVAGTQLVVGVNPPGPGVMGVVAQADSIVLVQQSDSGTWFCMSSTQAGTWYGSGDAVEQIDSVQKCNASTTGWGIVG